MPISVQCAACDAKLNAPDAVAGKRVKCPKCGQPLAIPALPVAKAPDPPPVERDAAPPVAPPVKKVARRRDGDDLPTPERDAVAPKTRSVNPLVLVVAILCGLFGVAGVVGLAMAMSEGGGPPLAANPKGRPNPNPGGGGPFNPGPFNPGRPNPDEPYQPVPLTPTDLTSKGLHATIDLPAGATFGTGYADLIKLPRGASFDINSADKGDTDAYFDGQMAKAAVVEKTDTAVLAEEKNQFGGGSTYYMRATLPIGDRKLVVKQTVYGSRGNADAQWAVVKTLRQTEAQQKAEKPRQEALAKFKAADQFTTQGSDGVHVSLGKPTPELLAAVKDIPDLTSIDLNTYGQQPDAENAKILPQLPHLRKVSVSGTDEELVFVGQCAGLTELSLGSPRATDAGLAPLANLTKLTSLNLSNARISGSGLAILGKMPALVTLRLSNVPLADDSLRHLSGLPELTNLTLSRSAVTDAGVAHLTGLAKLNTLDLDGTPVRGGTLGALAGSPKLTTLNLSESAVSDAGLTQAGRLTVASVSLRNTRVGDAGVAVVAKWSGLNSLYLDGTGVTDAGLAVVAGTKLQSLDLGRTAVTDAGVLALADSSDLSSLTLSECPVTDAVVAAALRCPKLSSLGLQQTAVSDAALAPLARLGKDRYLSVSASGTKVTATAAKAATRNSVSVYADEAKAKSPERKAVSADPPVPLAKLKPADPEKLFKALNADPERDEDKPGKPVVSVYLSRDNPPLADADLAEVRDLKTLRTLSVNSEKVTDGGLAYLAGLAGLEMLTLSCDGVTGSGFVHLQKLPKLKRLSLGYPKDDRAYTADDLRPLAAVKSLESLTVPRPASTRVLFDLYGQLPKLKQVIVNESVRAADVKELPPLPSVQEFRLAPYGGGSLRGWATAGFAHLKAATVIEIGPAIDDATAEHLAKAGAVRDLSVVGNLLTERGWKAVAGLPELSTLTVKGGHLDAAAFAALAAAPKLDELTLTGGTLGDPTLSGLAGAKGLAALRFKGVLVTDAALPALAKLPMLEAVEFANTAVTKAGVDNLRKMKPGLDVQFAEPR